MCRCEAVSHTVKIFCLEYYSWDAVFVAVRLVAELQSLEALDVFGMMKESSLNSLAAVVTDGKVCYQFMMVYDLSSLESQM